MASLITVKFKSSFGHDHAALVSDHLEGLLATLDLVPLSTFDLIPLSSLDLIPLSTLDLVPLITLD